MTHDDQVEGYRWQERDTRDRPQPHQHFEKTMPLHRVYEGALTDRRCLMLVSPSCSFTREASLRCPSPSRLRHIPATAIRTSRRIRGVAWLVSHSK